MRASDVVARRATILRLAEQGQRPARLTRLSGRLIETLVRLVRLDPGGGGSGRLAGLEAALADPAVQPGSASSPWSSGGVWTAGAGSPHPAHPGPPHSYPVPR